MRKQSFRWSGWARQDSNLRPLGDQPIVTRGSILRAWTLSPGQTWSILRAQVQSSHSKPDDKPTVDHGSRRPLGQRLTDPLWVGLLFLPVFAAVLLTRQAGAR